MSSGKSRVLLLTHRFPYPPNRGDRIRAYHLLRSLCEHYETSLACISDEPIADQERAHIDELCEEVWVSPLSRTQRLFRMLGGLAKGHSLTTAAFHDQDLQGRLNQRQAQQPWDAVLVFCSGMFPYVAGQQFDDTPVIVDLVDVDSCKWRQMGSENRMPKSWIYRREFEKIRAWEKRIHDRSNLVTLVSQDEANLFQSELMLEKSGRVLGVSNGVNTEFFSPPAQFDSTGATSSEEFSMVFTGVLNYYPNVSGLEWFCEKVMPQISGHTQSRLQIVGRFANSVVDKLGTLPGVELVGEVADVRPYLDAADVAIAPLHLARGIQNKVLEAMAMAKPVVCTSQAAEGIVTANHRPLIIADSDEEFAQSLIQLAGDAERRRALGRSARAFVMQEFSWSSRLRPMLQAIDRLVSPNPLVSDSARPAVGSR